MSLIDNRFNPGANPSVPLNDLHGNALGTPHSPNPSPDTHRPEILYNKAQPFNTPIKSWSKYIESEEGKTHLTELKNLINELKCWVNNDTQSPTHIKQKALRGLELFEYNHIRPQTTKTWSTVVLGKPEDITTFGITRENLKVFVQLLQSDNSPDNADNHAAQHANNKQSKTPIIGQKNTADMSQLQLNPASPYPFDNSLQTKQSPQIKNSLPSNLSALKELSSTENVPEINPNLIKAQKQRLDHTKRLLTLELCEKLGGSTEGLASHVQDITLNLRSHFFGFVDKWEYKKIELAQKLMVELLREQFKDTPENARAELDLVDALMNHISPMLGTSVKHKENKHADRINIFEILDNTSKHLKFQHRLNLGQLAANKIATSFNTKLIVDHFAEELQKLACDCLQAPPNEFIWLDGQGPIKLQYLLAYEYGIRVNLNNLIEGHHDDFSRFKVKDLSAFIEIVNHQVRENQLWVTPNLSDLTADQVPNNDLISSFPIEYSSARLTPEQQVAEQQRKKYKINLLQQQNELAQRIENAKQQYEKNSR